MARTVVIEKAGGPEALKLVDREVGDPGPGQIRIRHKACGLNFIDVYQRSGLYKLELPHALGMEASGVVEAVGDGVTHLKPGDRAAYASMPPGAYSEARVMPAAQVCPLPDGISFEEGAAIMLQGMTVEYLFHRTTPIAAGDRVLFHAAAGGVGLLACQWARSEGIELIGTAGSDEKCRLAAEAGAAHVVNYRTEDFVARVKEITDGAGVDVVMDGVGKDTFDGSLDCLRPLGFMISFGNASGPV
jgi:NADPH2:quinone reductase